MTTTTPVSESILHKVRSLITKANSTEFPAEAEAFIAKAQELISRFSIDAALLRDADPAAGTKATHRNLVVRGTYASARGSLLNSVAKATGVRCIRTFKVQGGFNYDLVGFESDIDLVELLFTELDLHLATAVARTSARDLRYESLRAYRTSFTYGFAARIGQRLQEANRAAEAAAKADERPTYGAATKGVALALVNKTKAVDTEFKNLYPRVTTTYRRTTSGGGYNAGHAAGGSVNLNRNKAVR